MQLGVLVEVSGRFLDQAAAQAVELHGVFAEQVVALRSDEERGIGKDEIEASASDRGKAVAGHGFDVVDGLQAGIESRAGDGAFSEVGGYNDVAVTRRAEAEDAAAGAQVQRGARLTVDCAPRQEYAGDCGP